MAGRGGARRGAGRPRLPTAVKKAHGTYRPSRAKKELGFPIAKLSPPSYLDEHGLEEWNRIVPLLDTVRVLTDADLFALANYCNTVSVATRAAIHVNKNGLIVPLEKGSKMRHVNPHIKIAREARAECLRFAVEFGLTPAARSRVTAGPGAPDAEGDRKKNGDDVPLFGPPKLVVGK